MAIKKVRPPKSWWHKIGLRARNLYRKETFESGKNVYGGKWAGGRYSPEYEEYKSKGTGPRQAKAFANKVTPVFTSDTFRDLQKSTPKVKGNGVEFGFYAFGDRVRGLAKRGKDYTLTSKDQPLPDKVSKYLAKEYNKYIKKNSKNKTRHHRKK